MHSRWRRRDRHSRISRQIKEMPCFWRQQAMALERQTCRRSSTPRGHTQCRAPSAIRTMAATSAARDGTSFGIPGRGSRLRRTCRRWIKQPSRFADLRGETNKVAINLKPVDVAVVGLGAAGGVAVLPLCRAGLKVAGIEAGTWMDPHKDFKPDEIHNNIRRMVTTGDKIKREAPTIRHSPTGPARRGAPSPMMNAVGGSSIHYQAQSWRLKPWDFKTVTEVTRRYGNSYIPEGSTVEDWPIG